MRLWPELSRKRIFGVFRAQRTCLVAADRSPPLTGELNSAPPSLLTGFEGHFEAGEREGDGRKGGRGEGKEGKGRKGRMRKHLVVNIWLRSSLICLRVLPMPCVVIWRGGEMWSHDGNKA